MAQSGMISAFTNPSCSTGVFTERPIPGKKSKTTTTTKRHRRKPHGKRGRALMTATFFLIRHAVHELVPIANVIRLARDGELGDPGARCRTLINCCGRCSSGYSDRGRALKPKTWSCGSRSSCFLQRTAPKRLRFSAFDRLMFVGLYRLFPNLRMRSRSSGRRPLFDGTVPGSEPIGVGDRGLAGESVSATRNLRELCRCPAFGASRMPGRITLNHGIVDVTAGEYRPPR